MIGAMIEGSSPFFHMELIVLFIICAVLVFAPRKGGRWPSKGAILLGMAFLLWFLVAMGFGTLWNHFFGTTPTP
jgi:hypothetical protein